MTAVRHWATTSHPAYLPRLRVLHASMQRHCGPFLLHVLAEGREVEEWAKAQPDVTCTPVSDFLRAHPDLLPAALPGPPRNGNELACTWRWRFVCDLMERSDQPVMLVDADVMFWSKPTPVFEEIGDASAAFIPHAFAAAAAGLPGPTIESHGRYGRLNGGLSWWSDPRAAERMAALARIHCRADDYTWPSGRVTWGDQGILSIIEEEFGAHVIRNHGVSAGPWNANTQKVELRDCQVIWGATPLVSFHYSSLRLADGIVYQFANLEYEVPADVIRHIYYPYVRELMACQG